MELADFEGILSEPEQETHVSPRHFGLPHDEWYPYQFEAVLWSLSNQSTSIIEAPTGSGKTGIAAAQGVRDKTMALVGTKFLQETNYEQGYGFIPLYGKGNYECVHPESNQDDMADDCMYAEAGMSKCPYADECPYLVQRDLAREADRSVLNYAYWFNVQSFWPGPGAIPPSVIVCDEAHRLSEQTLQWAGCTINEESRKRWKLPSFPIITNSGGKSILTATGTSPRDKAYKYLSDCRSALSVAYQKAQLRAEHDPTERKKARRIERFGTKIRATMDAMNGVEDGWYIRSGPRALGTDKWGFICKPLTARYHFPEYFMGKNGRLIIMSATIGDHTVFSEELGIQNYNFMRMESSWSPEQRPIYAADVPRMGRKSTQSDYDKQADEIAKLIKACPSDWSGIIHTTSIMEAGRITDRLHKRGLSKRVIVCERMPTNDMVNWWKYQLSRNPNLILVSWALWEGYDGTEEKINIVAKTPYPFLGDPYEKERQKYDGKFFLQRTAWQMEQGLGRTRRGRPEDYDTDDKPGGLVVLADGGWKWVQKYLSESTRKAIVT